MEPLLPWKSISITQPVCMCSLSYTSCNAHGPHCRLWPGPLYKISSHYLIKFVLVFMSSSLYSCPILMKLQLSRHS